MTQFEFLALEIGGIAHRPYIDQRAGQKCPDKFDIDGKATLYAPIDDALDDLAVLECVFKSFPCPYALGALTRQLGFAETVFEIVEGNFNLVANLYFEFAALILELAGGNNRFGFEAGADDDGFGGNFYHPTLENRAWLDALVSEALLEQFGEIFGHLLHTRLKGGPMVYKNAHS
jgi:hypothetical protein